MLLTLTAVLAACLASRASAEEAIAPIEGAPHFDQMATMVGEWYRTDGEAGDGPVMTYELAANGSAAVERLLPGMEKEMVTMGYMGGDRLLLTRYCALGNEPSMVATGGDEALIEFDVHGASNLGSPDEAHMHQRTVAFLGENCVDATWVLWDGGSKAERRLFRGGRRAAR
ncbi:MAG: hypothetical protein ACPGPE_05030 [Planctomycetota bacterium]